MTEHKEKHDDARHDAHHDAHYDNRDDACDGGNREDAQASSLEAQPGDSGERRSSESAPVARRGRSGPLVWLAFLVSLCALGLASFPVWSQLLESGEVEETGPSTSEFEALSDRVDAIAQDRKSEIEALRTDLDKLASRFEADEPGPDASELADRIEQLSVRIERLQGERNTALGELRTRLDELENEVGRRLEQFELKLSNVGSSLDRADRDLATRFVLTEVDSLFAIAQNHLVARGDGGVALQAWERAMERLKLLDGAEFQSLKDTARREFSQLQDYQPPDLGTQIEQLFGMADAVAAWPVKTIQPGQTIAEPDSNEGWRARLGQVVGSLVRVESVDREFLGPDEVDLARERVRSTLQTAALAMVRSRPDLARRLIGEATDAAQDVFDTEAANVSEALERLEDIAASAAQIEPPALTDSRAEISRLLGGLR